MVPYVITDNPSLPRIAEIINKYWGLLALSQNSSVKYVFQHKPVLAFKIKYKSNSFKSSENIQKKECGPDRSVSDNQSSSVTLNKLAMKTRKSYYNFKFKQRSHTMTDIKPNEIQII